VILNDRDQSKYIKDSIPKASGDSESQQLDQIFLEMQRNELEQESKDVQEIVRAVESIVQMVNQMSTMITEQGTIVDRIDYNLEVASARTLKGEHYFEKAERKNKQAGYMALYCIGILAILNSILGVLIMYKASE